MASKKNDNITKQTVILHIIDCDFETKGTEDSRKIKNKIGIIQLFINTESKKDEKPIIGISPYLN
jgi:hypothetical protein